MRRSMWLRAKERHIESTKDEIDALSKEYDCLAQKLDAIQTELSALDQRLIDLTMETYEEALADARFDELKERRMEEKTQ